MARFFVAIILGVSFGGAMFFLVSPKTRLAKKTSSPTTATTTTTSAMPETTPIDLPLPIKPETTPQTSTVPAEASLPEGSAADLMVQLRHDCDELRQMIAAPAGGAANVFTVIPAFRKLFALALKLRGLPDCTPEQTLETLDIELKMYLQAMRWKPSEFRAGFDGTLLSASLADASADGQAKVAVYRLYLDHCDFDNEKFQETVVQDLVQLARQYPENLLVLEVFNVYVNQFVREKKYEDALKLYQVGYDKLFTRNPNRQKLQKQITKIEAVLEQAAARKQAELAALMQRNQESSLGSNSEDNGEQDGEMSGDGLPAAPSQDTLIQRLLQIPGTVKHPDLGVEFEVELYTIKNNKLSIKNYRNKLIVFMFFTENCEDCDAAYNELKLLQSHYSPKRLVVIGIPLDRTEAAVERTRRKYELDWPIIFYKHLAEQANFVHPVASDLQISTTPSWVVLDFSGKLAAVCQTVPALQAVLKELLP